MDKKTEKIEVMSSIEIKKKLAAKAKKHGMSLSEFGLFCMLNSQISCDIGKAHVDVKDLVKLRKERDDGKITLEQYDESVAAAFIAIRAIRVE